MLTSRELVRATLEFANPPRVPRQVWVLPGAWSRHANYVQIAHRAGKKFFMHSDGYIVDIYPDLTEIGVGALNSQIFCIGVEKLAPFAGNISQCEFGADAQPANVRQVFASWNLGQDSA